MVRDDNFLGRKAQAKINSDRQTGTKRQKQSYIQSERRTKKTERDGKTNKERKRI